MPPSSAAVSLATPTVLPRSDTSAAIAARMDRLPLTSYQRGIFLVIATAWFFDSMDLGALTFVLGSIRAEFALSPAQAGVLSSMSFIGMFAGASTAGLLADRFGRTVVFQTSMIFWGLGSVACGLAPTMLLWAARVLLGFGMGMEFPVAQSMVSEIMPAKNRGRYIAYLEGFWPVGFIVSGLLSLAVLSVTSWRWVFILEGLPAIWVLVVRRRVPESPRWLASWGHADRAEATMAGIERAVQARTGVALPSPAPAAAAEIVVGGFAGLWTGIYARRTAMLWGLWFFALLGFYGLTTWLGALLQQAGFPVTKSVYYTILISLAGIPGFLAAAWLVEAWGRKGTCIATCWAAPPPATSTAPPAARRSSSCSACACSSACSACGPCSTPILQSSIRRAFAPLEAASPQRSGGSARCSDPTSSASCLPVAGTAGVFSLGAGAFVAAAAIVLVLGEETRGRALESISH